MLTGKQGCPAAAHQLDNVGDAEPVGLFDVLTSFHKTLVALKSGGAGVRQTPHSTVVLEQDTWNPSQNPIRLEAGPRVLTPETASPQGVGQ